MQSERLFKEAPVWQAIGALVGPSVLSVLVMIIYNMTDLFFIGLLQDTALTAAVAVVGPVFTLASAGATVLGMGGCAVVAGSLGAGDRQDARCVSSLCGWCALLTGVLLAVVLNLFCEPILYLLGTNAEILPYATHYLRILALGAPAMIFSVSAATLLRADGAIRRGLVGNLAGSLTNILLDPLFILAFGWDIAGAAAATMLGNLVASGLYLHHILCRSDALSLRPSDALRCPSRLGRVLTLGLPNGVSSLLSGLAGSFSNRLLAAYGTNALAAMAAADKSAMVVTLVQMGICMGLQPLLSYNVGGRNLPRLRAVLSRSFGLTVGFGTLFALFCLLAQRPLIGLFFPILRQCSWLASFFPGCWQAVRCWACTIWASISCRPPAMPAVPPFFPPCARACCWFRPCTGSTICWGCPAWRLPVPPPTCSVQPLLCCSLLWSGIN